MPSQIFIITRAPEADPMTPQQIRRMIFSERTDSEWEVKEMVLTSGSLVEIGVIAAKENSNGLMRGELIG